MEIIVFENAAYYKMLAEMKRTVTEAIIEGREQLNPKTEKAEEWVTAEEAQKILKCKVDKLKELRDEGEISASKKKRAVLYYVPSLYKYLTKYSNNND